MNRAYLVLPIAAVFLLSLSGCGRNDDQTSASNPELPRTAQAPSNSDRPAAGTPMNPDTSDPSIPNNPANTDPNRKDTSPPYGTGDPPSTGEGK